MIDRKKANGPSLKMSINNSLVTIYFSQQKIADTKDKVRDILTSAYEERLQKIAAESRPLLKIAHLQPIEASIIM